ncbi:DUF4129 domain-containing protein [Ascidiimonas sp. W6]|uniref:DUF4129 domain-containing protein n=1 Tax=Ascidiimonas meishanensis TaxID=3128903 RepID=UPI0030EB2C97
MRILFLFICCLTCISALRANSLQIPKDSSDISLIEIKKEQLEKYKNNPDYDYNTKKNQVTWWQQFKNWVFNLIIKILKSLFNIDITFGILSLVFRILIYGSIGLLIFLLVKLFLKVGTRSFISSKTNTPMVSFSEEEDIIQNENIPSLIEKALANKEFRLAVRYQYLLALKELSDHHMIEWEQQKTNDDYLSELSHHEVSGLFSSITKIYDFIWYGNFDIDESRYAKIKPVFTSISQKINMHG